jgi:hypothetical protein
MRAVAIAALGKIVGQSLKGKFVVRRTLRRSYLRLMTWKRRSAAREPAFETPAGPVLLVLFGQVLQELGRTPAPCGGERQQVLEMGGAVAQAESREPISQGAMGRLLVGGDVSRMS